MATTLSPRGRAYLRQAAAIGAVAMLLSFPVASSADPAAYEPAVDPAVGVNLISWWNFGPEGAAIWEAAVQDIYDEGLRAVSISPLRFVYLGTGEIQLGDGRTTGPDLAHVEAGIARAAALGMSVTVNPFVEPKRFTKWRAEMNFTGTAKTQFWNDYSAYLLEFANIAETYGVARMTIGTELNSLVEDPAHNADWTSLIAAIDAVFSGQLGYASNWDDYWHPNLALTIWEHPAIDFMGVDTYVSLASSAEATGMGNPSVATLESRWLSVLTNPAGGFAHGILPYAAARKGGAGMPVVMTEHGTIPFDGTVAVPYSAGPGKGPVDPYEQRNDYEALMRASDQRATTPIALGRLDEIHIWQWSMPGADGSLWLLDPDGDLITTGAKAAQYLTGFIKGDIPDPGAPQNVTQQGCIYALNLRMRGVVKAQGKSAYDCVRDHARGRLGSLDADTCLGTDRRGKVGKAEQNTAAAETASCGVATPDFGPATAAAVNQAAIDGGIALPHDIFGSDLDVALIPEAADRAASRCQQSVFRAVSRCFDERIKEFSRCKKTVLKNGAGSAADLALCIGSDPGGRVARRCNQTGRGVDRVRGDIVKRCVTPGVDLASAFVECQTADPDSLHTCLSAAGEQRACSMLDSADDLGGFCD